MCCWCCWCCWWNIEEGVLGILLGDDWIEMKFRVVPAGVPGSVVRARTYILSATCSYYLLLYIYPSTLFSSFGYFHIWELAVYNNREIEFRFTEEASDINGEQGRRVRLMQLRLHKSLWSKNNTGGNSTFETWGWPAVFAMTWVHSRRWLVTL